ncbi:MAG: type II secretion system protein N [Rudaea sp.]|nr:type II secretion system protein N [Rudaea sp.]
MRRFLVVILLLIVAAAAAIYFCPASIGYRYLMKPSKTVVLSDLSGTIWNGHAASIAVHDRPLGQLDWQLHFKPLLEGRRVADFSIAGDALKAQGTLTRSPAGNTFDNLSFSLPASAAAGMLHFEGKAEGDIQGTASSLTLLDGWPTQLREGKLRWDKAKLAETDLGAIDAAFDTAADGNIAGTLKNTGGAAQFNGAIKLKPSRDLELNDLSYKLPAPLAATLLRMPNAKLTGEIDGQLAHILLRSGSAPAEARGNLHWNDAATASVSHELLGNVEATFDTAADGGVAGTLKTAGGSAQLAAKWKLGADRALELNDATLKFPASLLTPLIHLPGIEVSGDVDGNFARLALRDGLWPSTVAGKLVWHGVAVAGARQATLGDLELNLGTDPDGSIIGVLNDLGGPLQINGTFKATKTAYDAAAQLTARGDAAIAAALRKVGTPQPDGSTIVQAKGEFK